MKLAFKDAIRRYTINRFNGISTSRLKRRSSQAPKPNPEDVRLAVLRGQMIAAGELLREALSLEFEARRLNMMEERKECRAKVKDCAAKYTLAVAEWRRGIMDEAQSALLPNPSPEMGAAGFRQFHQFHPSGFAI